MKCIDNKLRLLIRSRNFNEEKMQNSLSPKTRKQIPILKQSHFDEVNKRENFWLCLCWSETKLMHFFFISSLIVSDKVRECFQFSMRNKSNNEQTKKKFVQQKPGGKNIGKNADN